MKIELTRRQAELIRNTLVTEFLNLVDVEVLKGHKPRWVTNDIKVITRILEKLEKCEK